MRADKANRNGPGRTISVGGISILMVFVMLCLTTFGLLTLATARAEMRLTEKNAQSVKAYYASSSGMQEILARIDGILTDNGKTWDEAIAEIAGIDGVEVRKDGTGAVVEASVTDNGPIGMALRLSIDRDKKTTIEAYHMKSAADFDYQDGAQAIWPGN